MGGRAGAGEGGARTPFVVKYLNTLGISLYIYLYLAFEYTVAN